MLRRESLDPQVLMILTKLLSSAAIVTLLPPRGGIGRLH
jgi:hypothetical protein